MLAGSRADSWKPWYSPSRERRRPQASPWGERGSAVAVVKDGAIPHEEREQARRQAAGGG